MKEADKKPRMITEKEYRFDAFTNGEVLWNKKKNHLPAMGWNSWNAFGSGNTEELTKKMADAIVELGLDQLGYQYVVLDDGCYKSERINGELSNEDVKFPNGFRSLSDYIHKKGLKFGMYNDIGTNLCAGAAVGTCGHEMTDAKAYLDWGVDFIKVDNCYYLWDNATFSDATNARYVYTPNIKSVTISGNDYNTTFNAVKDGTVTGRRAEVKEDYVNHIGTFDGTGPWATPVDEQSSELTFNLVAPKKGSYQLTVCYATGKEEGIGEWLQVAVNNDIFYDDLLDATETPESFVNSKEITIELAEGNNLLRLMNHRRQENTLCSYAALLEGFKKASPDHDVILSICEWGKTQPQNWGYKVGDSWRILNDITFRVGSDGNHGFGTWVDDYTPSVTSQYNKAVIMDEFAGLDKGWNDPDMLMVGMDGLTDTMYKTHMTMWCMMNSPLMLGLDLRRVKKGDTLYQIIANKDLIALNQDSLGIQAKRIFCSLETEHPDTVYVTNRDRVDILAKPLSDGSIALSFINVSEAKKNAGYAVTVQDIQKYFAQFITTESYEVTDLWTGENSIQKTSKFEVASLEACDNVTIKITPMK